MGFDSRWEPYYQALKTHVKEIVRPDTEVKFSGVEITTPEFDKYYYFEYLNTNQLLNNAIRAEREGYNAFAIGCILDPGFPEVRGIVNIPVVFVGESSMHVACMMGERFSIIVRYPYMVSRIRRNIKRYGLEGKAAPLGCLDFNFSSIIDCFKKPEPFMEAFAKESEKAVNQGADVLIPGCMISNMVLVKNGIKQVSGTPILDGVGVAVKVAEAMADLNKTVGLSISRKSLYASPGKEKIEEVRKLYGLE